MADGPINYEMADPQAAIINGLKLGAGIQQVQAQQQQQQLAQQAAVQQQTDLARLASNPNATHADFAAMMTKYPALAEHLGKAYSTLSDGQKQGATNLMSRIYALQAGGNHDMAADMMDQRAKIETNPAEAQHWQVLAQLARSNPQAAQLVTSSSLAALAGPDKFATSFSTLGKEGRDAAEAPADLLKKRADAATAVSTSGIKAVEAQNAPTATVLANEKDRQTILSADAQRQVAAFNAQIAGANSETQRGELTLRRDEFVAKQKATQQAAGNEAQDQFDNLTQSMNLVHGLQKDLSEEGWLGKWNGVGTTTGKLARYIPGSDAKDFSAKLETLKSQQFLTQAKQMKGMGALSDAEGARIERAVASLDAEQTVGAFKNALGVIETNLAKGHAKLVARGQLPKDGGAYVMSHPVYGNVGDSDINRLMAQNPGSTREQVIQYLQNTEGKP